MAAHDCGLASFGELAATAQQIKADTEHRRGEAVGTQRSTTMCELSLEATIVTVAKPKAR
jgi:hypothetical protein